MLTLPAIGTLLLLFLATFLHPARGTETCGFSALGFFEQGEISYQSPSDTCQLELIIEAGSEDNCTATTYYSSSVQYTDVDSIQHDVPSLNTITYTGPAGSVFTNYFPIPFASIQIGDPIVATFTESGAAGVGILPITWTQEPLVVTSNTVATTTVTDTTDVYTTSTSTITSSSTITVTPQTTVVTTTVGTSTVTAPTSTTTLTSTITPRPKTQYGIDIVYETTTLPCNWRGSRNLRKRQQPGTCYEFPDFTDTQTTTTITTSTSIDYTIVTTTDTITDTTVSTVTTTTTAGTPTSYADVTATVTTTPVTTSTVYTKAHRSTTTEVQTFTIAIPVFPTNPPCHPKPPYGGPPHPGGPWIQCPGRQW